MIRRSDRRPGPRPRSRRALAGCGSEAATTQRRDRSSSSRPASRRRRRHGRGAREKLGVSTAKLQAAMEKNRRGAVVARRHGRQPREGTRPEHVEGPGGARELDAPGRPAAAAGQAPSAGHDERLTPDHARFAPAESRRRGGDNLAGKARASSGRPPSIRGMRRLDRLIAAAVLTLVAAAPAAADSIAYVQGGDVWLATPDGARKRPGHAHRQLLLRLAGRRRHDDRARARRAAAQALARRHGARRLPHADQRRRAQAGPVNQFHGPFNPQISPDGTKVAFEWFNDTYDNDAGLLATDRPAVLRLHAEPGRRRSRTPTGYTGPEAYGLLTGWIYPHWMSNDTLLRSYPGAMLNDDAVFTARSAPTPARPVVLRRPAGPRRRRRRALARPEDRGRHRRLQRREAARLPHDDAPVRRAGLGPHAVHAGNQPVAQQCYELTGKFESTTLAPSGKALAYGTAEGIYVAAIPDGCAPGDRGALVLPGARFPDWGPADVPRRDRVRGSTPATGGPAATAEAARSSSPRAASPPRSRPARAGKATLTATLKGRTSPSARDNGQGRGTVTRSSSSARAAR